MCARNAGRKNEARSTGEVERRIEGSDKGSNVSEWERGK